jgi:SpoVK/Ycf46/Vps4 family AAA+-type ATPase
MIKPPINTDISNNVFDISKNKIKTSDFFNLHNPSNIKLNNICNNYLNNNDNTFNMRLKNLLDNVDNERKRIENQLLLEDKKIYTKQELDSYIYLISNKYDSIYRPAFQKNPPPPGILNPFDIKPYFIPPINKIFSPPKPLHIKKEKIIINATIENIHDILELIKKYPIKLDVEYNINMQSLHNIEKPLTRLDNMIGMVKLKSNIVNQILYFVQDLHKNEGKDNIDFMHTVIYGPPGTGKTEIANIIGDIFSNLGILRNKIFKKATRSELVAGFLGQTALKTNELIKSCLGGCLFIDEAYALGNIEKRDSFAKECIDTLCEALSFYKNDLMVIIAGYEKDLKDCFFSYNAGLESRFTWRFNTDNYDSSELNQIFHKKVKDIGWNFKEELKDSWFTNKMDYFKYFGRDMETLLAKTKICHSKRVFCKSENEKRNLSVEDIDNGFNCFMENDEVKSRKDKGLVSDMYI